MSENKFENLIGIAKRTVTSGESSVNPTPNETSADMFLEIAQIIPKEAIATFSVDPGTAVVEPPESLVSDLVVKLC